MGTPLSLDELDAYRDTFKARGGKPLRKRLYNNLDDINDINCQTLVVGYKGAGKVPN